MALRSMLGTYWRKILAYSTSYVVAAGNKRKWRCVEVVTRNAKINGCSIVVGKNCIMTNVMHKFLIYLCTSALHVSGFLLAHLQWSYSSGYGVTVLALTPYPADLNHCRSCTPASEDGLKESPKHVRQKYIDR
jgi:hypothetical protein